MAKLDKHASIGLSLNSCSTSLLTPKRLVYNAATVYDDDGFVTTPLLLALIPVQVQILTIRILAEHVRYIPRTDTGNKARVAKITQCWAARFYTAGAISQPSFSPACQRLS